MQKSAPSDYLAKAEKWFRWGNTLLAEMNKHAADGQLDDVERNFTFLVFTIATLHEALDGATARLAGWETKLDNFRTNDPLLRYLWKARDSELHAALTKWTPTMHDITIDVHDSAKADAVASGVVGVNAPLEAKYEALLMYAYAAITRAELASRIPAGMPSRVRMERAGFSLRFRNSLGLRAFTVRENGKWIVIDEPTTHEGKLLPNSAFMAVHAALLFYQARFAEIASLVGHQPSSAIEPPPSPLP
jgi:hypothetical protein